MNRINKMKLQFKIGETVDLIINGKRNKCEVEAFSASIAGVEYDLSFKSTDEDEIFYIRRVRQDAIQSFQVIRNEPIREYAKAGCNDPSSYAQPALDAPSDYPLWMCLEELKSGRPAADQLWLQQHIDQLKLLSEAQV